MANKLVEKRNEYAAKAEKLGKVFDQAGPDMNMDNVTEIEGDAKSKVESIRKMNAELADLKVEIDGLADLEDAQRTAKSYREQSAADAAKSFEHPSGGDDGRETKGFGELFTESDAFARKGASSVIDVELKTLFETSAGWAPETTRIGRLVEDAQRPIEVIDVIPPGTTDQAAIVYMEETTFTNNAAETAEAGQYPEAALELTERSESVRKIPVFIPVTDEQLEDEAQVRSYIENRLRFMIRQRLDAQVINGDGNAPNLTGVLNKSNVQTQAKSTDSVPDALHKAIRKVRVTGRAMPNAIIMHPEDWEGVRLLKTADGIYIWGNPAEAGPERVWGLPVVQFSGFASAGTAVVGDFANHSQLYTKRGIEVKISDSHSDYFIKGKQAIRADMRVAFVIYRPEAFCEVTGL